MQKKLITVEQAADILNVSVDRVYAIARENILPVVRIGRQIRVDPEQLDEFIASGGQNFAGGWKKESDST